MDESKRDPQEELEDVEGHGQSKPGRLATEDEDVEGHGQSKPGRLATDDEDVEGHGVLGGPTRPR